MLESSGLLLLADPAWTRSGAILLLQPRLLGQEKRLPHCFGTLLSFMMASAMSS